MFEMKGNAFSFRLLQIENDTFWKYFSRHNVDTV